MKIVFSSSCLNYQSPGHPESPDRIEKAYRHLLKIKELEFIKPEPAKEDDLYSVHTKRLVESVNSGNFSDPDTPALEGIFFHALLGVGAALKAVEVSEQEGFCFSLMRPPGHHAGRDFLGGFCYFNNVAIACQRLIDQGKKAAIIDFDCHHGNGTQDIFLNKPGVIYLSLHQSPWYPGTGVNSEGNCLNFPLKAGTGEAEYIEVLKLGLEEIKKFSPDFLCLSCGFDNYKRDPLGGLKLEKQSYFKIGQLIKSIGKPALGILEGGYTSELGSCIQEFLKAFQS